MKNDLNKTFESMKDIDLFASIIVSEIVSMVISHIPENQRSAKVFDSVYEETKELVNFMIGHRRIFRPTREDLIKSITEIMADASVIQNDVKPGHLKPIPNDSQN